MDKLYVYILHLENDKYYVGKTYNVEKRFKQHQKGSGSLWTQIHKPLYIEAILEDASPFDEDRYVKEYMFLYGIDNVRGGAYLSEKLKPMQIKFIKREIGIAEDLCMKCGGKGHFASYCSFKKSKRPVKNIICTKCSRKGHYASRCKYKVS